MKIEKGLFGPGNVGAEGAFFGGGCGIKCTKDSPACVDVQG